MSATSVLSVYEGASQTKRTLPWRAPSTSPNQAVLPNLATLRDRSRSAARNDSYAKGTIDRIVFNLIGTGIKPLSQTGDEALRAQIHALWARWTDESDADGLLDFYGQQTQAARGWLEGGDMFIRLRTRQASDGLSVPLQLQVLEPELVPHTHTQTAPNGNRIKAGIEFDAIGRRVAYWFYTQRPGDPQDVDSSQLRRVPAHAVIHLYDPLRAGQLRGLPILTQSLVQLYELQKSNDAALLKQQLANMIVGFLKLAAPTASDAINPLTGVEDEDPGQRAAGQAPSVTMEPATIQTLLAGEDITFAQPPSSEGYPDFVRHNLRAVAAASGVPYELLTGDMTGLNDRVMRVLLNEFRRRLQVMQHQIFGFQFCRRVYQAWLDLAFLSDALPLPARYAIDRTPFAGVKWMPHGWPYLHPVQDIDGKRAAIRAGFSSRAAEVGETGEDVETIDAQQAADHARADALGLSYDSDGRRPATGPVPGVDDDLVQQKGAEV